MPEVDETLTFKVIEFSRDDKRIIVSHTRYLNDIKRETEDNMDKEKVKERKKVDKIIKKQTSSVEKTTLGELDAFSELKSQFENTENEKKAAVKKEVKKAPAAKKESKESKVDDLKKIEGIGPKIAGILNEGGINTFGDLASTDLEKLKELLSEAGNRYKMHDPSTWSEQSKMAADDKWDELKEWQDKLDGGKKQIFLFMKN